MSPIERANDPATSLPYPLCLRCVHVGCTYRSHHCDILWVWGGRAFFDYFLEKNILGQILDLLGMPHTPKVQGTSCDTV